ncbi:MAG: tol-pal system protein YbgF, partial [Deltaproteobacteria bacterium]|nr:tol-pal system protein YbgF [Deltaproteobacteria bacterium]
MNRTVRGFSLCALLVGLAGCAATNAETRPPEWQARLDDASRAQARLEMRVDEVTRSLLALRERLEAQEAALKQLREEKEAAGEAPVPALEVVKVEPLPQPPPEGKELAQSPRAAPEGGAPSDLYRRAMGSFRDGRYGQSILDFEEFLGRYPDHEYADNAQYWIGECYYSQREYAEAIVEFGRVLERFSQREKAPDALLKIGLSYQRLGEAEKARSF